MKPLTRPCSGIMLAILFVLGFGMQAWVHSHSINLQWDFGVYYLAGHVWVEGGNPYNPDALRSSANSLGIEYHGLPFLYPPWALGLFSLFSHVEMYDAAFLWLMLKCLVLQAQLFIIAWLVFDRVHLLGWAALNIAALIYRPIAEDISTGNITLTESTVVLGAVLLYQQRRWFGSALAFCAGASLKWVPLFLLILPWRERNRAMLPGIAAGGGIALVLAALDWRNWVNFVHFARSETWALHWDEQVQSVYNSSLVSLALRTFSDTYFFSALIDAPWMVPLCAVLVPAAVLGSLWWVTKGDSSMKNIAWMASLLIMAMLLISPRVSGYTMVWTLFPVVVAIVDSVKHRNFTAAILALMGAIIIHLYIAPSSIESGLEQLLIDKNVFGCALLYAGLLLLNKDRNHTTP